MGKLVRYKDSSSQCWSRVDLENGDPIYIGIAGVSVLIKKSNLGILGAVLYKENDRLNILQLGTQLRSTINEFTTPDDMNDVLLKVFTQLALDSDTIEEFCRKIWDAEREKMGGT